MTDPKLDGMFFTTGSVQGEVRCPENAHGRGVSAWRRSFE